MRSARRSLFALILALLIGGGVLHATALMAHAGGGCSGDCSELTFSLHDNISQPGMLKYEFGITNPNPYFAANYKITVVVEARGLSPDSIGPMPEGREVAWFHKPGNPESYKYVIWSSKPLGPGQTDQYVIPVALLMQTGRVSFKVTGEQTTILGGTQQLSELRMQNIINSINSSSDTSLNTVQIR